MLWNRQSLFAHLIQARSEVPRLVLSLKFSTTRLSAYHVPCTSALQFLSPLATIRCHLRRCVTLSEAAPLSATFSWHMTTCWKQFLFLAECPYSRVAGYAINSIFQKSQESHELRFAKSAIAARHIR